MLAYLFGSPAPAQPHYTNNALFVNANDLINQSLDLLVIFKFYAENQKDISWLRHRLIEFFATPHDGASPPFTSFKYQALLKHLVHTAQKYESFFNIQAERHLNTFISSNAPLRPADADLALCVIFSSMDSIPYDEYHGTWYWSSKKQISGLCIVDYSSCLPRFRLCTESQTTHLESLRSQGKYIDVFNYANDRRLQVTSDEDYLHYKDQGEALRQALKESLNHVNEAAAPTSAPRLTND
jgi:hypothetical protein